MNIDTLVAINIFNENKNNIINKIPILFYWNGEGDLINSIFNDQNFIDKYFNNLNYNDYCNLKLGYFYFKYNDKYEEIYTDNIVNISEYLKIDKFNSKNIIYELILKHLFALYEQTLKVKYKDVKIYNEEIIIDIYRKLKEKYKDKIIKSTFINWVREELLNKDEINNTTVNYIIDNLKNILKNES